MAATVDRWTPEGRRFMQEIEKLKKLTVRVGYIHGKDASEQGVDIADIAAWNELGTARSPAHPFMRSSADNHTEEIRAFGAAQVRRLLTGAKAQDVLSAMGTMQKALIQNEITEGRFAANDPYTIRKKGSDVPLVDTGRMRQSVHIVVKRKGAG